MNVRLRGWQLACLVLLFVFVTPCWSQTTPANAWQVKLVGALRAHLHVPPGLSDRTGEVWVDFTIDRSGFVKSTELVRGAGIPELDKAVLAAIEAAQPFPVPPGVEDSALKIPVACGFPLTPKFDEEKLKAQLKGICRGC
jgi:TonB family protein